MNLNVPDFLFFNAAVLFQITDLLYFVLSFGNSIHHEEEKKKSFFEISMHDIKHQGFEEAKQLI